MPVAGAQVHTPGGTLQAFGFRALPEGSSRRWSRRSGCRLQYWWQLEYGEQQRIASGLVEDHESMLRQLGLVGVEGVEDGRGSTPFEEQLNHGLAESVGAIRAELFLPWERLTGGLALAGLGALIATIWSDAVVVEDVAVSVTPTGGVLAHFDVHGKMTELKREPFDDPNWFPCEVAPLEAFSDELAEDGLGAWAQPEFVVETGRESSTVNLVFMSRCCGYQDPPTAGELYEAMRRDKPTERDLQILRAWIVEATERQWLLAWTEQAYSWRMLARAVKLSSEPCWTRIRNLNTFTIKPELVPREWRPITLMEHLETLPEPTGRMWTRLRDPLADAIRERIHDFAGWRLSGGTILAIQWEHRESTDIDLKCGPKTGLALLNPRRDPTFDEQMRRLGCGGARQTLRRIAQATHRKSGVIYADGNALQPPGGRQATTSGGDPKRSFGW